MYDKNLDYFIAAADRKSFTKAAEKLYISHTRVIKRIDRLENSVGVKLFVRTNRGISLTRRGQCMYGKAKEIIEFSQNALEEVRLAAGESAVTVRVGASLFYPCNVFINMWDSINSRHLKYKLKVVPIADDENRFAGFGKSYDFVTGPYNYEPGANKYSFIPIGDYKFCISLPKSHKLAKKSSLSLKDLQGRQLLMMAAGYSPANDIIRRDVKSKNYDILIEDIPPHYTIETFNLRAEKNIPLLSLECWDNVHPAMISVPLKEKYTIPYGIVTDKNVSPKLREFIEILKSATSKPNT